MKEIFQVWIDGIPQTVHIRIPEIVSRKEVYRSWTARSPNWIYRLIKCKWINRRINIPGMDWRYSPNCSHPQTLRLFPTKKSTEVGRRAPPIEFTDWLNANELIKESTFQVWIDGIPQTVRIRNPEIVSRK